MALSLSQGSMGSLDMGGASTEIAFKVNKSHLSEPFYTNEVLFNRTYPVYARSYLCYGHIEAAARFLGHLVFTSVSDAVTLHGSEWWRRS